MIKSILDVELIKRISIFALAYALLFNLFPAIELSLRKDTNLIDNFYNVVYCFANMYMFTFIIFFGITVNIIAHYLLVMIFFIIGAITNYHLYLQKYFITSEVIKKFNKTDPRNLYLLDLEIILLSVFIITIALYSIRHFKIDTSHGYPMKILSLLCFLLMIYNIIYPYNIIVRHTNPILFLNKVYYAI